MSLAFVSSLNQKIYKDYGKNFINEFVQYASKEIKLYLVFEGDPPPELEIFPNNIIVIPFISNKHTHFMKFFGQLYEANGYKIKFYKESGENKININSDYHFNSVKFSYKPFAIHQLLPKLQKDIETLLWTDADLRCKKKFDSNSLKNFLPDNDILISYLGRKKPWYSECGFLGFNLKHPDLNNYINRVIDIYVTGEIFSLEQWHDSWIWDHVRLEFEKNKNTKFKNISGEGANFDHPFVNCGLEEFFDHLKGVDRKKMGKSFDSDFKLKK